MCGHQLIVWTWRSPGYRVWEESLKSLGIISQFISCNRSVSRRGEFDLQPGAAPSGVVSEAKVGKGTGSVP